MTSAPEALLPGPSRPLLRRQLAGSRDLRHTVQNHGCRTQYGHLRMHRPLAIRSLREPVDASCRVEGVEPIDALQRRGVLKVVAASAVAAALPLSAARAAQAFGLSGPKDWLREQKKRTAPNLLKPIEASRSRLDRVVTLLEGADGGERYGEAIDVVHAAARDCTAPGGAFQACTYGLILKNAASLVGDGEGTRLQANAALEDLITSFSRLDERLQQGAAGTKAYGSDVDGMVRDTQAAMSRFADSIKGVLGVPL